MLITTALKWFFQFCKYLGKEGINDKKIIIQCSTSNNTGKSILITFYGYNQETDNHNNFNKINNVTFVSQEFSLLSNRLHVENKIEKFYLIFFFNFVLKPTGIMMVTWSEGHIRSNIIHVQKRSCLFIKKLKYFNLPILFPIYCHTAVT